jgi:hypothetical protein
MRRFILYTLLTKPITGMIKSSRVWILGACGERLGMHILVIFWSKA